MKPRRRLRPNARVLIRGYTGSKGGRVDAHLEPGVGTPGQFEGPMDGRLSGYPEELARKQEEAEAGENERAERADDDQG
jgi:hypothetical protein